MTMSKRSVHVAVGDDEGFVGICRSRLPPHSEAASKVEYERHPPSRTSFQAVSQSVDINQTCRRSACTKAAASSSLTRKSLAPTIVMLSYYMYQYSSKVK